MHGLNPRHAGLRGAGAFLVTVALSGALAGSVAAQSPAASGAAGMAPIPGREQPLENTTGKQFKIGLISFPGSNEFFSTVKPGSDAANAVLANYGAQVDYITVNDFTQDAVNAAGQAALLEGYDALAFLPLDPAPVHSSRMPSPRA